MAKERHPSTGTVKQLVTESIQIRSANRSAIDIGDWHKAWTAASRVDYQTRVSLLDIYDSIRNDGHLKGIVGKRISAVVNKSLHFEDASGKRVEAVDKLIGTKKFRQLRKKLVESIFWGFTLIEFIPGKQFAYKVVPRKHVHVDTGIISREQSEHTGWNFREMWNMFLAGEEDELGLFLILAVYALYKRGALADYAQFIEIFGLPLRIVYYDAHDRRVSTEIDKALDESGSALVLKLPKQAQLDIKDGKQTNGDGQLQETFRKAMNEEMSVATLGNTETTNAAARGGYALGKVHSSEQFEVTKDDMQDELDRLNSEEFLAILKSYGYPVEGGRFVYDKEYNSDAVKSHLVNISMVKKMGVPVDDDYVYEVSGIPKPKNYDQLKQQQEQEKKERQKAAFGDPENELESTKGFKAALKKYFPGFFD